MRFSRQDIEDAEVRTYRKDTDEPGFRRSKKKVIGLGGILTLTAGAAFLAWCFLSTVPAGYVGVRVNLYSGKGVQEEVLGVGRYIIGPNQQLFKFPTFNQLANFKQPFNFQSSDAMEISAKVGVEFNIDPAKASKIFQTYRKGIQEICEVNLRQYISDGLIKNAVKMDVNELTQGGKARLLEDVTAEIREKLAPVGIRIVKLSWIEDLQYPEQVRQSINAKIEATQRALLRENEVAQSKAEAEKLRVAAQGEADARITRAKAEAEAIAIKAKALRDNPDILQLNAIDKWNGVLPQYLTAGAPVPFVPVK